VGLLVNEANMVFNSYTNQLIFYLQTESYLNGGPTVDTRAVFSLSGLVLDDYDVVAIRDQTSVQVSWQGVCKAMLLHMVHPLFHINNIISEFAFA
jgi:hypothetical protein